MDEATLWKLIYRLVAIGDYTRAIDLIYRWQGYDEQQVANLFLDDTNMDLMEISPLLIAAAALFEAPDWEEDAGDKEEDWRQWQLKVHHIMKMRPIQDELYTLLQILTGKDVPLLSNVVLHWQELLLAVIIYIFSSSLPNNYAWDQIIALVEQYYTLPTELHGVIALLQGNYTELIADVVHLKSFWHAAHLADLLCRWNQRDARIVVYDKEDIRKYYILEYVASLPIHHVDMVCIIRDYCRTCGQEGYKWLEQRHVYSLPWNSCDWNTLEDWWLEEEEEEKNVKQQQCTTRNRLQRWIFQSRMMKGPHRYFDCLYVYCRFGEIQRIEQYLENPMGLAQALEQKKIHQVVYILQSIVDVIKAANACLLDAELSYVVAWLHVAQYVYQQDVQHAMEYFAMLIACCAMGTKHSRIVKYSWQLIQLLFESLPHQHSLVEISTHDWLDIVAGIQNMKTTLSLNDSSTSCDRTTDTEDILFQRFAVGQQDKTLFS